MRSFINVAVILLAVFVGCILAVPLLGLLFGYEDRGSTFLRNVDELVQD
jgi:hypothetical protein